MIGYERSSTHPWVRASGSRRRASRRAAIHVGLPRHLDPLAGARGNHLRRRTEHGRSVWQLKLPVEGARIELEEPGGPWARPRSCARSCGRRTARAGRPVAELHPPERRARHARRYERGGDGRRGRGDGRTACRGSVRRDRDRASRGQARAARGHREKLRWAGARVGDASSSGCSDRAASPPAEAALQTR